MRLRFAVAPALLVAASGCLASKSDIQLIQEELRATRAQSAAGDTSILRADDARRSQIAQLSTKIDRMNDSLRFLSTRLAAFQATVNGELDGMGRQMVTVQAMLGQTTRNVQDTRAQLEALKEQGMATAAPAPVPTSADPRGGSAGLPGAATLFTTAMDQLNNGSYRTARSGFDQLLTSYPDFNQAPVAQLHIGETYRAEGNTAAADSVYQLVAARYPKSQEAPTAMYRHGKYLWDANKRGEARVVLNRVIRDYPGSDEAVLAKDVLTGR
jgi:tol-pal system protein YbgF